MKTTYIITEEINFLNSKIYSIRHSIVNHEKKIDELYYLKQKYAVVDHNFTEFNRNRSLQAERIADSLTNSKFSKKFGDNLQSHIDCHQGQLSSSIVNTIVSINNNIAIAENELVNLKNQISSLSNQISNLEYQLRISL